MTGNTKQILIVINKVFFLILIFSFVFFGNQINSFVFWEKGLLMLIFTTSGLVVAYPAFRKYLRPNKEFRVPRSEQLEKTNLISRENKFQKFFIDNWAFLLILAIGFLLRVYQLGRLNVLVEEQFHYIPGMNLAQGKGPKIFYTSSELFAYLNYTRTYLYTFFTALLFKNFGVSELCLRIPAVVSGLFSIGLVYFFSKKFVNKNFAILASSVLALSSWHIWYSRWARHYILDDLTLILTLFALYYIFFTEEKKTKVLWFVLPACLIPWVEIGNYIYILVFGLLVCFFQPRKIKDLFKNWYFYLSICAIGLNVLAYKTFVYFTERSNPTIQLSENKVSIVETVLRNFFPLKFDSFFVESLFRVSPLLFGFAIIAILCLVIGFKVTRRKKELTIFFALPLIELFLSFYDPGRTWTASQVWSWEPRHAAIVMSLFYLTAAFGIYLAFKAFNSFYKPLVIFLVFASGFSLMPYTINYGQNIRGTTLQTLTSEAFYTNTKEPVLLIKNNFKSNTDKLVVDPMEVMYRSYWDRDPEVRIGWDSVAKQEGVQMISDDAIELETYIVDSIKKGKRVWLIESSYNLINYHNRHRNGQINEFLKKNGNTCKVYSQQYTNVYLFSENCFNLES